MKRLYKHLLRLYPAEYQALFAEEMSTCFEKASEECRERGVFPLVCGTLLEFGGLVKAAYAEWIAKFTYSIYHSNSYLAGRCLPDSRLMRPAGVARNTYSVAQRQLTKTTDLIDGEMCVNAHQRFVFASSPRRLLILTCEIFLPMHRR